MLKAQEVLKKISEDPNLMAEFKKAQSFEELYELCKKIEPNITEPEIEEGLKELITENSKNTVSPLSNEELAAVAGGSIGFNRTKTLALSALMLTGVISMTMLSNNAYAKGTVGTTSISQKVEVMTKDQQSEKSLNKNSFAFKGDKRCLGTDKYGVEILDSTEKKLHLQVDLFNSGMNFAEYKISKVNDVVFISIYGGFDSTLDNSKRDTSEDFTIKYSIPDDVDAVYLRGNTKDDVKIIWKSK